MVQFLRRVRRYCGTIRRNIRVLARDDTTVKQREAILEQRIVDLEYQLALDHKDRNWSANPRQATVDVDPSSSSTPSSDDDWSNSGSSVVGDWQDKSSIAQTDDTSWSSAGERSVAEHQYESTEAGCVTTSNLIAKRKIVCTCCDELAAEYAAIQQKVIRPGSIGGPTRVFDSTFYTTMWSKCYVPLKLQTDLRSEAYDIAKRICFNHMWDHCPEVALLNFPECHSEVRLGCCEIKSIRYPHQHSGFYRTCIEPCPELKLTMEMGTGLRNAHCHAERQTPRQLDEMLENIQCIAIILRDEQAAFQVRKLRNALQELVKTSFAEIERRAALSDTEPYERWETHYERLFDWVNFTSEGVLGMDSTKWPECVVRCARRWQEQKVKPGEMSPQHLERMRRAASLVEVFGDDKENGFPRKVEAW